MVERRISAGFRKMQIFKIVSAKNAKARQKRDWIFGAGAMRISVGDPLETARNLIASIRSSLLFWRALAFLADNAFYPQRKKLFWWKRPDR
jgi:hypothetical protein